MKKMRKILLLVLCVSAVVMSGCTKKKDSEAVQDNNQNQVQSAQQAEQQATPAPEPVKVENGAIGTVVEDGKVKVTLPGSVFGGKSKEMAEKVKENRGFEDAKVESDDSVTFTMTQDQHEKWLLETAESTKTTADNFIKEFAAVKEAVFNDDFTDVTIKVDKASYKSERDKVVADGLATTMFTYQSLNGVAKENLKVSASFVDAENGEQIEAVEILGNN